MIKQAPNSEAGYSLLEVLIVLSIMAVVSAMGGLQIITSRASMQADGGMRVVLSQMRMARELAITERRFMRVTFVSPDLVQIVREEAPGPATSVVQSQVIEGNMQFVLITGLPDTPDSFGAGSAIDFGVAAEVKFTPDGTMVNQNGQTTNGSVFLAMPSEPSSARSVTVLGSTGRLRAYRWDGRNWKLV